MFDPEREVEVKLDSPIARWKELLGDKNPETAKAQDPVIALKIHDEETGELKDGEDQPRLRGIYGKNEIRNAFWGSDDAKAANKERDIFLLPIPEKPPVFSYEKTKVNLENILQFMFPPNLEHSNSTGRLDLFALYGPTVDYHSVDSCFCNKCISMAKAQLQERIQRKNAEEMRLTGTIKTDTKVGTMSST